MKAGMLIRSTAITFALLLIPFAAMQLTKEVNWSAGDFIIMGLLLFATILAFSLAAASRGNIAYRIATCLAIGTAFLLVWANLAVGLLGSGPNFANLMYGGMVVVGIASACLFNFQAAGMARTMFTMALLQVLVPVIALAIFQFERMPGENFEQLGVVAGVTGFFTALWLAAALLFQRTGSVRAGISRQD
jgi:hypothetical protein